MDFILESIIVSIDSCIFAYFLNSYLRSKSSLQRLKTVPQLDLESNLYSTLKKNEGSISYACLRGNVVALSPALQSFNAPSVTGVVQKVTVREHVVCHTRSGFWVEKKNFISEVFNSIPFAIRSPSGNVSVEVVDALNAKVLDLEVVADKFEPSTPSFGRLIWQFLTGVSKQGYETVEEVLKEGTLMTVVGEVVGKPGSLSVGPPSDGAPFFITTMPLSSLMRRVEADIKYHKWVTLIFGGVTVATFTWIIYKRYKRETERNQVRNTKRERRKRGRTDENLPQEKICVVCQVNPKEVILLPCGHVCLCEDCSDEIKEKCPICNGIIQSRNEAYIA